MSQNHTNPLNHTFIPVESLFLYEEEPVVISRQDFQKFINKLNEDEISILFLAVHRIPVKNIEKIINKSGSAIRNSLNYKIITKLSCSGICVNNTDKLIQVARTLGFGKKLPNGLRSKVKNKAFLSNSLSESDDVNA